LHVEVKKREDCRLEGLLLSPVAPLSKCVLQMIRDSRKAGRPGMLLLMRNRTPTLVVLDTAVWCRCPGFERLQAGPCFTFTFPPMYTDPFTNDGLQFPTQLWVGEFLVFAMAITRLDIEKWTEKKRRNRR